MENNTERMQVELNHRLIELNNLLIDANREQTKMCRHLLGGVRLLEDLYTGAELCECCETGQRRFTVSADEWERVAAYLADFAAANEPPAGSVAAAKSESVGVRQ